MSFVTLPNDLDFKTWVYCLINDLPNMSVPLPSEEEQWAKWVESLIYSNPNVDIPLPRIVPITGKKEWREWAEYFIVTVESLEDPE